MPTPRFGHVSLVGPKNLGIDVDYWYGNEGAPIVGSSGEVVGVLWALASKARGVLDSSSAGALAELTAAIGKQGSFEPHPPASKRWFSGFYASPLQSDRLQGAGILTGYRREWLAVNVGMNFSQSQFVPTTSTTFVARTKVSYDSYGTLDLA